MPVLVAEVVQKAVPRQIRTFGSGEAYATVTVKSMVAGQVTRAHIAPGQAVKAGDLLFTIDARPFEADVKQLEAVLARNKVLAAESERQASIAAELSQRKVASNDETARARAAAAAQQATLLVDQSNIDRARLDLEYCVIKTPITGRAGDLLIREGSVIKANDIAMVVIAQMVPIYVSFAVPQVYLPEIRRYMAAGSLEVSVAVPGEASSAAVGKLAFIDNTVDQSTGTIRLKALFENATEELWPGEFVDVVLTLSKDEQGVVIPSQAVQRGQAGSIVFVVRPDQTVEVRPVTVSRTIGDESIVGDGLKPGETVVIDGQLRLLPGAKVEIARPRNGGATLAALPGAGSDTPDAGKPGDGKPAATSAGAAVDAKAARP